MASAAASASPLRLYTKFNYGMGATASGVALAALSGAVLQYFLNQVMRLPAILVGTAIMVSLIVDAIIDPLVGQWSDNLQSRWGRRHPFMYAAAVFAPICFYGLWNAPRMLSGMPLLGYMLVLLVALRISVSLFDVPNNALMPELAPDYDQRTVLSSFRWFFLVFGAAGMSFMLNGVFLRKDATHPLGLLNRHGYEQFGLLGSIMIFIAIMWSSLGTHDRISHLHRPPVRQVTLGQTLREIGATVANPSLVVLLISGVLGGAAGGMLDGLSYYFYTHFWGLLPTQLAVLLPLASLGSVIAVFAAPPLAKRFGKKGPMIGLCTLATLINLSPMTLKLSGPDAAERLAVDIHHPPGRGDRGRDAGAHGIHHHHLDGVGCGGGHRRQDRCALGRAAVRHQWAGAEVHRGLRRLLRRRAGHGGAFPDTRRAGQRAHGADEPYDAAVSADLRDPGGGLHRGAGLLSHRPAHP